MRFFIPFHYVGNDRFWFRDFDFLSQRIVVGLGKSDSRYCRSDAKRARLPYEVRQGIL